MDEERFGNGKLLIVNDKDSDDTKIQVNKNGIPELIKREYFKNSIQDDVSNIQVNRIDTYNSLMPAQTLE